MVMKMARFIHLDTFETVSKRIVIIARFHSPTTMKPMNTEAGPPVWNALAEPTNRPAPIAPPLTF